jgi:hypothetical protein
MKRPSWKELSNKINQAKDAIVKGSIRSIDPIVIAEDAIELDYQVSGLQDLLVAIFNEIEPKHYIGSRPPQKSYKSKIEGLELFAFRWVSKTLGCEAYIKFSLKQDIMYLVSLHQHREEREE